MSEICTLFKEETGVARKRIAHVKTEKLALLNSHLRKILYRELAKEMCPNKNDLTNETF